MGIKHSSELTLVSALFVHVKKNCVWSWYLC